MDGDAKIRDREQEFAATQQPVEYNCCVSQVDDRLQLWTADRPANLRRPETKAASCTLLPFCGDRKQAKAASQMQKQTDKHK